MHASNVGWAGNTGVGVGGGTRHAEVGWGGGEGGGLTDISNLSPPLPPLRLVPRGVGENKLSSPFFGGVGDWGRGKVVLEGEESWDCWIGGVGEEEETFGGGGERGGGEGGGGGGVETLVLHSSIF